MRNIPIDYRRGGQGEVAGDCLKTFLDSWEHRVEHKVNKWMAWRTKEIQGHIHPQLGQLANIGGATRRCGSLWDGVEQMVHGPSVPGMQAVLSGMWQWRRQHRARRWVQDRARRG